MKRAIAVLLTMLLTGAPMLWGGIAAGEEMGRMAGAGDVSIVEYSWGGGMGGSGESRTVSHARSTTAATTPYNGLELKADDGLMQRLVLGGTPLNLTLDGAAFTASFVSGDGKGQLMAVGGEDSDTLVLTASSEDARVWRFDGVVLQKLLNSGLKWLCLLTEAEALVLPTEGFLAGYAYDELKTAGVPGGAFAYAMAADGSAFSVTVQGKTYALAADGEGDMYLSRALVGDSLPLRGVNGD